MEEKDFGKEKKNFSKRLLGLMFVMGLFGVNVILMHKYVEPISQVASLVIIHLGTAILIASVVGFAIELVDIRQYVEDRLKSILINSSYLNLLDESTIRDLIFSSFESLIRRKANNPEYDFKTLPKQIRNRMLLTLGETYYSEYSERVEYKQVEPFEVLGAESALNKDLSSFYVVTEITLTAPGHNEKTLFHLDYPWSVRRIRGLEKEKHFSLKLFVDDDEQDIEIKCEEKGDIVEMRVEKTIEFINSAEIRWEGKCYMYGMINYYSSYMNQWTKEAEIIFSMDKPCDSYIEISGITTDIQRVTITPTGSHIRHPGWFLPKQGYFISWEEKEINNNSINNL